MYYPWVETKKEPVLGVLSWRSLCEEDLTDLLDLSVSDSDFVSRFVSRVVPVHQVNRVVAPDLVDPLYVVDSGGDETGQEGNNSDDVDHVNAFHIYGVSLQSMFFLRKRKSLC